MSETTHGTARAEQRIRALLAALPPGTRNLGGELVHSAAFRSEEWPRGVYALERTDMEAVLALLDETRTALARARSLCLAHPADAVDPERHTPERVRAYLQRLGWVREGGGRVAELWHPVGAPEQRVTVPLIPTAPDYAKVLGFLVSDLADLYGPGQLVVLAAIEAACDA